MIKTAKGSVSKPVNTLTNAAGKPEHIVSAPDSSPEMLLHDLAMFHYLSELTEAEDNADAAWAVAQQNEFDAEIVGRRFSEFILDHRSRLDDAIMDVRSVADWIDGILHDLMYQTKENPAADPAAEYYYDRRYLAITAARDFLRSYADHYGNDAFFILDAKCAKHRKE